MKQSLASAKSALEQQQAMYKVGITSNNKQANSSPLVNLLEAVSAYYDARLNYNQTQYNAIKLKVALSRDAGLLSVNDLIAINDQLQPQ